jgi:hypothetical protein
MFGSIGLALGALSTVSSLIDSTVSSIGQAAKDATAQTFSAGTCVRRQGKPCQRASQPRSADPEIRQAHAYASADAAGRHPSGLLEGPLKSFTPESGHLPQALRCPFCAKRTSSITQHYEIENVI